jgi:hypothetical protein
MYQGGIECYIILTKWEKVENVHHSFFTIKTHEYMRIIHKVHKIVSCFGTYEIKISQVKGLRLRKLVCVSRTQIKK